MLNVSISDQIRNLVWRAVYRNLDNLKVTAAAIVCGVVSIKNTLKLTCKSLIVIKFILNLEH
jgi:hypothetical protein